ncbi:MAG: DMT family transporter [Methanomassiliicoccaceae archaeon]|nr:DMT family transporter [Methanomassiliicoccaceae archaeon]
MNFGKGRLPHLTAFLVICMTWGLSLVVAYDLLDTGIPPFFLVAVTYGIGAFTLFFVRMIHGSAPKISSGELRYGLAVGLLIFAAFGLQTAGLGYTTPARSGLLTVLYVLFVPLIISAVSRRPSPRSVVFALIGFAGVFMMSGTLGGDGMNIGDILTIMCAIAFAIHFVALEKLSPRFNTLNFTLVQMIGAAAFAVLVSVVSETAVYKGMDLLGSWAGLLFMGLIVTGAGFFVQTAVQKKIPSTTISVMCCTESVFALLFSWLLGYDVITAPLLIGAALIVSSTVLSSLYERRELID